MAQVTVSKPRKSILQGIKTGSPLIVSATFFGLIFGFTGAVAELPWYIVSMMSFIIFAGSAQFLTLLLIIEGQPLFGIFLAAVIINLRHFVYGTVLKPILKNSGIFRLITSYFLIDESFLITTLVNKNHEEDKNIIPDWVLIGSGATLWIFWNGATLIGYFLYSIAEDIIDFPGNFIISASFIGFLVEQWVKYPKDRAIIVFCSIIAFIFGFILSSTWIVIAILLSGAFFAPIVLYWRENHE